MRKHIIVCGHITVSNVKEFLKDFYHPDRDDSSYNVAILSPDLPSIKMEAIIKRRELYVSYFQGEIMETKTLERLCVKDASAVLILSDVTSSDTEAEDSNSIMRVITVKDYCPDVSVLVVLTNYRSKTNLKNIPDWSPEKNGDAALCVNEVKMGFLAKNCSLPGFSSLLCNLLVPTSEMETTFTAESWQDLYYKGSQFEFYKVPFSMFFNGMDFAEAAAVSLDQLELLLIAVEVRDSSGAEEKRRIIINPGKSIKIDYKLMEGFVIATDGSDARKLSTHQENLCDIMALELDEDTCIKETDVDSFTDVSSYCTASTSSSSAEYLDSTCLLYWTEDQSFRSRVLDPQSHYSISNHIIVCILDDHKHRKGTLDLFNFVLPLRTSLVNPEHLQKIIFVGDSTFVWREWDALQNFPKLYVLHTSPLNRAHLRAICIESCAACVILAKKPSRLLQGEAPAVFRDNEALLCTLNIKTMKNRKTGELLGDTIHITTELNCEKSIDFIDQDDEDGPDEAYMTQAFATGRTFLQGLLQNLLNTAFYNKASLDFLRTLMTTATSDEVETQLNNQGFKMQQCQCDTRESCEVQEPSGPHSVGERVNRVD